MTHAPVERAGQRASLFRYRMKILVTGGAGYIGSVCAETLLDAGHSVAVYDDLSEGHRAAVDPRASFIQGRPDEPNDVLNAFQSSEPEAVMHFAASALVGESMLRPEKYFQNNVVNGLKFLDAAVACKVRKFVFSSTCATYGHPAQFPITEDTPQCPVNPYGESKLMLERMLRWYHQIHGLEFIAFRYFNAAGASQRFGEHHRTETHLIPNVLSVALGQKQQVEIHGADYPTPDGTCVRDYIHVADIAQAHILGLQNGRCGFYNLGNGDGYSVLQVIETCEVVIGKKIPCVMHPRRPGDPPKLVACTLKARRELAWAPKNPRLTEIVDSAWHWHRLHPTGYSV